MSIILYMDHQNPRPFLKWVGGKRQLISQLERLFPPKFNNYIEPFIGGGAVFFWMYRNGKIHHECILNDKNAELINCYKVIRTDVEPLIVDLKKHKNEEEYFLQIRNADRNRELFDKWSDVEKASRMIYLNKTCFNGLYRVNQKGEFNAPFGRYKNPAICDEKNLRAVATALENVTITCGDFEACLQEVREDDLIYFDPPYHPLSTSSSFTSYTSDNFGEEDQWKVLNLGNIFI